MQELSATDAEFITIDITTWISGLALDAIGEIGTSSDPA